tara:strand:- start:283608 stop:283721 length:114 start_codon:yes stop_codon:yes gene_type:complete
MKDLDRDKINQLEKLKKKEALERAVAEGRNVEVKQIL